MAEKKREKNRSFIKETRLMKRLDNKIKMSIKKARTVYGIALGKNQLYMSKDHWLGFFAKDPFILDRMNLISSSILIRDDCVLIRVLFHKIYRRKIFYSFLDFELIQNDRL